MRREIPIIRKGKNYYHLYLYPTNQNIDILFLIKDASTH